MNATNKHCAVIAIALLAAGCAKESKDSPGQADPSSSKAPTGDETADKTGEPISTIDALFADYEKVRSLLADDTADGVADHANRIKKVAGALASIASDEAKPHLVAAESAAGKLAAVADGDIAAQRMAFGELSQALVGLRDATPELAASSHVFECPMAKGYKRWIQPNEKLENPYMGSKMIACGSEIHDHHQGNPQ